MKNHCWNIIGYSQKNRPIQYNVLEYVWGGRGAKLTVLLFDVALKAKGRSGIGAIEQFSNDMFVVDIMAGCALQLAIKQWNASYHFACT